MDCVQCICARALLNYETSVASINIHIVAKGIRIDWPDDNNIEFSWTGIRKYVGGQWFSRVTKKTRGNFSNHFHMLRYFSDLVRNIMVYLTMSFEYEW